MTTFTPPSELREEYEILKHCAEDARAIVNEMRADGTWSEIEMADAIGHAVECEDELTAWEETHGRME